MAMDLVALRGYCMALGGRLAALEASMAGAVAPEPAPKGGEPAKPKGGEPNGGEP